MTDTEREARRREVRRLRSREFADVEFQDVLATMPPFNWNAYEDGPPINREAMERPAKSRTP